MAKKNKQNTSKSADAFDAEFASESSSANNNGFSGKSSQRNSNQQNR
ncbi:hypothetical protein ACFPVX_07930 [Cohnella faecalis]|nr:hypothetical protein [Cohnella faecalis]